MEQNQQVDILKKKSSSEKLKLSFGLFDFARQRIASELFRLNPHLKPSELNQLVNQRIQKEAKRGL